MATTKRLILCCDGTWMNADDGFTKSTLIPYQPTPVLQVPSNITRISHALKRHTSDGMPQVIYYHSGVGTGTGIIDNLTGGLLGTGISENIREVYSFIASNYAAGDEIILIGFSRGAFTARSVAGMIRDIGLLTLDGMNTFYPIFKDQENFKNPHYKDMFPDQPFPNKPKDDAGYDQHRYKRKLVENGLTRVYDPDGQRITVKAVAVFDTVGSLGIPNTAFLSKLGLPHSTKEFKFYDTNITTVIKHAFQALALDEHRGPFSPAVWEMRDNSSTDLRQVWFPGAHSNIGGGYDDQEMANVTLAWMMDQLASIGVAFKDDYINKIFDQNVQYYENAPTKDPSIFTLNRPWKQWATTPIYEKHKPVRPWGLGQIYESETGIWLLAGKKIRTPGLYKRTDPSTGLPTTEFMINTNERIHSSVRVRLDLDGLDVADKGLYKCPALLVKGPWHLRQVRMNVKDPIPASATWGPLAPSAADRREDDQRWVWEYDGPKDGAPKVRTMFEENLGPYERQLLLLNKGRAEYKKRRQRRRRRRHKGDNTDNEDYIGQERESQEKETILPGRKGILKQPQPSPPSPPPTPPPRTRRRKKGSRRSLDHLEDDEVGFRNRKEHRRERTVVVEVEPEVQRYRVDGETIEVVAPQAEMVGVPRYRVERDVRVDVRGSGDRVDRVERDELEVRDVRSRGVSREPSRVGSRAVSRAPSYRERRSGGHSGDERL